MPPTTMPITHATTPEPGPFALAAQSMVRLLSAVRFHKGVVAMVMASATLLGAIYYFGSTRRYESKAALLVTQSGADNLNTSMTGEESVRRNSMPTFSSMIRSAKVTEAALESLAPEDCIDFKGIAPDQWARSLQDNLSATVVRSTSILEVSYSSKDPGVAANVVRAVVHAYIEFMDRMHKGAAAEMSEVLIKERGEVAEQLAAKQSELLALRRTVGDLGLRSDGKAGHPLVQRAFDFNDALFQVQKQRLEFESALASLRNAVQRDEDLSPHLMTIANLAGQELVFGSLGIGVGSRDISERALLEQGLLRDQAEFATLGQHLGPQHPELMALSERIRNTQRLLDNYPDRMTLRISDQRRRQLGPWLLQLAAEKLDETRARERVLGTRYEEARDEATAAIGQLDGIELLARDVKRLSDMSDILLNQLASIDMKQSGQAVRVAVIAEPRISKAPASPRLSRTLFAVVMIGVATSVFLVNLIDVLDDRFRSAEEIQNRLNTPLLAIIGDLGGSERPGADAVCFVDKPNSSKSEPIRTLRAAIVLSHPDARQILITSASSGDGKTTVAANLAACCAMANKRTLLIDGDMRKPGLTTLMNMRGVAGLSDLLQGPEPVMAIAAACVRQSGVKGFDVLPSGARCHDAAELLAGERFAQLLAWAEGRYDQVLIDAPPALVASDAAIMARLIDGVLIVMQPAKNRRRLVGRVVETLNWMGLPLLGIVANRVVSGDAFGYGEYGYGYSYGYGYGDNPHAKQKSRIDEGAQASERDRPGPSRAA